MRIIGGTAGGRVLKVPKGFDVRPTPDLVKQAVFNSLGERVTGAEVLELFGGSGALGFEALSRGAAHVICVEKAARHARMIQDNYASLGLERHLFEMRVQDAFVAIGQLRTAERSFELILADPPYGEKNVGKRSESFAQKMLDDPNLPMLLKPGGLLVMGHSKRDSLDFGSWQESKTLKHGDSLFRFLER
ncbi:MAG: 16S rRNA (guanine(966)-N(2))-methyltransferase RsmD [Verrucomicrobiota bacterium]|nr:16S rRNA (guanine(966)-N(2))-methyltransferase RsmD [Verrucomicrobiota bacterium]